ncbi:MAG: hypothetical protein JNG83_09430 [Opitutaceae bacterium]|nr:hypothetical protein [Opitutaceae bacterium]
MTSPVSFRKIGALLAGFALLTLPARLPAIQPGQIDALGLWLEAGDLAATLQDGARVLHWPDKSGKRFDAIFEDRIPLPNLVMGQLRPPTFKAGALHGRPAVAFDAADQQTLILNRAGHALNQKASGFTAVFLVKPSLVYGPPPFPGAAWTKNRYLFLTHVSNLNSRMSVQIVEGSGEVKLFSRPVPEQKRVTQNSSFDRGEQHALAGDAWHRLMVTLDYKAKLARIFMDGKVLERALPPESADAFEDMPSAITAIGSTTLGDWLTFQLAEMICYDKALTVDELNGLDAYLRAKYGLAP